MKTVLSNVFCLALLLIGAAALGQTQLELNDAAEKDLERADGQLNAAYKQVIASLNADQKELLKVSQRAWIKYRDLAAQSEDSLYEGGSARLMINARATETLTLEKTKRLNGMLPEVVQKKKPTLPTLENQQAELQKADEELNKIFQQFIASDPGDNQKRSAQEAETAWVKYRDACAKAEAALYDPASAPIATAVSLTELTRERINSLKALFLEGYSPDAPTGQ